MHQNKGTVGRVKFNFSVFQKLITNSSLVKAIQFAIFGHTYPQNNKESGIKPVCPFTSYPDEDSFRKAIKEFYPVMGGGNSELEEINAFEFEMSEKQFQELFAFSQNLNDYSYIVKKLKEKPEEERERITKQLEQAKRDNLN